VQPPAWLGGDAREFWADTAPALVADGRLRSGTSAAFAVLCELAVDCVRLSREVSEEGTVIAAARGSKTNPKVRLLRDARRDFLQYSKAFGLDPASSARIPAAATKSVELDPLEAYIRMRDP
jgi:P27 family predicted phage terminase small subunit